jgi:four helix bundle protein
LECWKAARALKCFLHTDVIPLLPKIEYDLKDQLKRAARSFTANIAEGYGRYHFLDNAKFCSMARGSCWEILDHLISASDEELISNEILNAGRQHVIHAVKILNGYIKYLQTSAKKFKEPETEYITNTDY